MSFCQALSAYPVQYNTVGIRPGRSIPYAAVSSFKELPHPASLRSKLHRIAEKVDQYLVQAEAVSPDPFLGYIKLLLKGNPLCLCLGLYQIGNTVRQLLHAEGTDLQFHFTALYFGHIQDIVDQAQQILGGTVDLLKAVLHFIRLFLFPHGNPCHTDDCIHRRTDFMGHAGKEITLGPACQIVFFPVDIALYNLGYFHKLSAYLFPEGALFLRRPVNNTARIFAVIIHGYHKTAGSGRKHIKFSRPVVLLFAAHYPVPFIQARRIPFVLLCIKIMHSSFYPAFRVGMPLIFRMYRMIFRLRPGNHNIR